MAGAIGVAAGIALVPSLVLPFVSLFLFDDPSATSMIAPYLLLAAMWAVPALLAGSVACALAAAIRPSWRRLVRAMGLAALPLAFSIWFFDPLKWRHYPPGQSCGYEKDRSSRQQWVCRRWP